MGDSTRTGICIEVQVYGSCIPNLHGRGPFDVREHEELIGRDRDKIDRAVPVRTRKDLLRMSAGFTCAAAERPRATLEVAAATRTQRRRAAVVLTRA